MSLGSFRWPRPSTKPKQRRHVAALLKLLRHAYDKPDQSLVPVILDGLAVLQAELRNRTTPAGRPVSDRVTPAKRQEVLWLRGNQPTLSQQEIAYRANLNIGRVSEILHGKRS